jgi:PAS domain S-box-containing protein
MSVAVFNDKFGALKGSIVCLQDVTQRKRAEEALRRSEERFRAVFEGAQDLIYIKDVALRYTHVNPAMEAFLGVKAPRLMGKTDEEMFGRDPRKRTREVERRVLAGQSIEQEQTRLVNGVSFTFLDIRVPLRNPEGVVMGICGISRNITERRKAPPPIHIDVDSFPSEAMRKTLEKAAYAAASDSIVLLLGDSGTGKDFLARWIHDHSARANGPFFSINCAALPQELAESELFGHEAGAFTGASGRKRGLLELAEGGTLLLNEIGELQPALQSKLLSFLDTRSFVRVRGEKSIHVDARLMAATHRELKAEVAEGRFLMPLFYRLNVLTIELPLLSRRKEDIPLIIHQIMAQLQGEMQLAELPVIEPAAMKSLARYHWPGNVRELRNVLERALMISDTGTLKLELSSLSPVSKDWSYQVRFPSHGTFHDIVDGVTQSLLVEALRRTKGNRKEAAKKLGISRRSVFRYLKRFGLE